jgi:hypothetical protein
MKILLQNGLPRSPRPAIMHALVIATALASLLLAVTTARAQEKPPPKSDELDVTMQIIVDPDAKLPDEVVRRIPLPPRKPAQPPADASGVKKNEQPADAARGQERAREARELGDEMSDRAKERAQEANEQREQARRSAVEKRRNPRPPPNPPSPPRPPR